MVNHNPIPDVVHDEFVRLVAPLLSPPTPSSGLEPDLSQAPFEWLHFEVGFNLVRCEHVLILFGQGRTVQTTLSNLTGLDGLAQERGWRNRVVFSVEISRPGRQGQEAVRTCQLLFAKLTLERYLAHSTRGCCVLFVGFFLVGTSY